MAKPAILCLHGRGTSGSIFEIQSIPLIQLLEDDFDFIFVDAPNESQPGPNVLPVFEDEGPFFTWLGPKYTADGMLTHDALEATTDLLDDTEASHPNIVGILGFSQGAALGLGLLLRDQRRRDLGMPCVGYRFGVFAGEVRLPMLLDNEFINSGATTPSNDQYQDVPQFGDLEIPTFHAIGHRDPFADQGKGLRRWIKNQKTATLVKYDGGHEMPRKVGDVKYLASEMLRVHNSTTQQ